MKTIIIILMLSFLSSVNLAGQIQITELKCENRINPLGIDYIAPRFTWLLKSDLRNTMQTAYHVLVSKTENFNDNEILWNSGIVNSEKSVHVKYSGKELESGINYFWKVRIWDNNGRESEWSKTAFWRMGILNKKEWIAKWITKPDYDSSKPCPMFRNTFTVNKKIKSATAFISSYGMYEAYINGRRIGDDYLTPGWTSYNNRLQYQVFEITENIKDGVNAVGAYLGKGWYASELGWPGLNNIYGNDICLLVQLQIVYADGTTEMIVSDNNWKTFDSPILSASIYDGEIYDSRMEQQGWSEPEFDDSEWVNVQIVEKGYENLIATYNEPISKHETFKPLKILKTPKGETVLDFGQNLVGWVKLKVKGKKDDKIKISHAEVLDKEGNFYTENLRLAKAQAEYILNGEQEDFEPHFTFFGFRYIKIEEFENDIIPDDFTAVALHSDMEQTGTFTCSDSLLNQLQHNIQWGQRGNFLDVPTDCPQRDERMGWTGDAQAFSKTAAFNMNVNNFFSKWLKDLKTDQSLDGIVPFVIPNVIGEPRPASGWSDAATIVPWNIYSTYGDVKILQDQYASMKMWVDYLISTTQNDLVKIGFQFGDWLFYSPQPDDIGNAAVTDKNLISQCFFAHSTQLLINAATVLKYTEDVKRYKNILNKIKSAFLNEFVTPNGGLVSNTQTAYVLALNFDMLPYDLREQAAERLVENVKKYNDHLTTGFLGTPYLNHVLTRFGYSDLAYKLLLQKTYPSWLYPVTMGATTIWERWDGIKPDSTLQTPGMNSFNHYAYGAIGDWMYRSIAGINNDEEYPGYKKIKIYPRIGGNLNYVEAELKTYYGQIASSWKIEDDKLLLKIEIPVNTMADIYIPSGKNTSIKETNSDGNFDKEFKSIEDEPGYKLVTVGSGRYNFEIK